MRMDLEMNGHVLAGSNDNGQIFAGSLRRCRLWSVFVLLWGGTVGDFSASPLRLGGPEQASVYLCTTGHDPQQALSEHLLGLTLAWLICRGQVSPSTVPAWAVH